MLKLFLWLRYLRRKKIVFFSIAAVALSVALLIIVNSLFTGFIDRIKNADITGRGDISFSTQLVPKSKYDTFIDEIEKMPEIESATASLGSGGLLWFGSGDVGAAEIESIDINRKSQRRRLKQSLLRQARLAGQISFDVPGHPNDIGGWVGIGVIAEPNEKTDLYDFDEAKKLIGKRVVLTTTGSADSGKLKRKVLKFRIADIIHSGVYLKDHALILPYDQVYRLRFGDQGPVQAYGVIMNLRQDADSASVKTAVRSIWEKFATEQLGFSQDEISRPFFEDPGERMQLFLAELHKQMNVLMLIFGIICSVAILLVFCIFYMIVETKQKDIAIIKSYGASSATAALIFTGFGACVGIAGSAIGIFFGYIVTININTIERWVRIIFGMKLWRSSVYMFETIPSQVNWQAVCPIVTAAVLGCIIGALIPAVVAAKTKPVEILRYE